MKSFVDTERRFSSQPARLGARLARVDTGRGREQMYLDQLPELLRALAQQTRIESITASSALEDVIVESYRAEKITEASEAGEPTKLHTRDEEEFAGYRDAMDEISRAGAQERMSLGLILHIHRQLFKHSEIRGGRWKQEDNIIGNRNPDGTVVKLFTPPPKHMTETLMNELVNRYNEAVDDGAAHPIVLIAAFIVDFLAIHPFDDGNGRVSRILTTQMLLERGYTMPRYVSVESRIFETKNSYYDALYRSQRNWHEAEHTIWPWVGYLVETLADSYDIFEQRVSARQGLETMSKSDQVRAYALEHAPQEFRLRELKRALPGISETTLKRVLGELKQEGRLRANGKGPQASWIRIETG